MREWRKNPEGPMPNPWDLIRTRDSARDSSTHASAHRSLSSLNPPSLGLHAPFEPSNTVSSTRMAKDATAEERQAASIGKLVEVDLGPEATLENIRRTEAAIKRMMGIETGPDNDEAQNKGRKRGRRGQPLKRRNSADQERDKKIEAFMKDAPCTCSSELHSALY